LAPHRLLLGGGDAEAAELERGGRLAGPPLDAPAGEQVEHRDELRDPRRGGEAGGPQRDAVAEADPPRALRGGGEAGLGARRVRGLLEEVVLDLPEVLDPEPVGELDLLERLLEHAPLRARLPRPRHLVLVEEAELHRRALAGGLYHGPRAGPGAGPEETGVLNICSWPPPAPSRAPARASASSPPPASSSPRAACAARRCARSRPAPARTSPRPTITSAPRRGSTSRSRPRCSTRSGARWRRA